jgi:hypothetical protein
MKLLPLQKLAPLLLLALLAFAPLASAAEDETATAPVHNKTLFAKLMEGG